MGKYDDIINLPHHRSTTKKHMSREDRAAQFGAFKALRGHDDALSETARLTNERIELDEYAKEKLNEKLICLSEHIGESPEVCIVYFVSDDKKAGGEYVTFSGRIKKIKNYERILITEDDTKIPINDILTIQSELTDEKFF